MSSEPSSPPDERPPLGTWPRMYAAVLILHLLVIVFFYFFSRAYA